MYLVASASNFVDRMLWPIAIRHFHDLLLDVDKASLLDSGPHFIVNCCWIAGSRCGGLNKFLTSENRRVIGRAPIVTLRKCLLLGLFEPASRLQVVAGALVKLIPLLEREGAE